MRISKTLFGASLTSLLAMTACSGDDEEGEDTTVLGEEGDPGENGDPGEPGMSGLSSLVVQTVLPAGEQCPTGGIQLESGLDEDGDGSLSESEVTTVNVLCGGKEPFTLQLLHFADVDGNESTALSNVDEFSALVDGMRKDSSFGVNTMLVSSGDNLIPGPRWFAAEDNSARALVGSNEPGAVDHFFLNQLGVVASAIGNHELDQGPGEFSDSLQSESFGSVTFPGTTFPYLAANIDFSGDDDLSEQVGEAGAFYRSLGGQVAPSATVTVGGELIGLVGVSTPQLSTITTTGALTVSGSVENISELAAAVQPTIDDLLDRGIDKIVLLSHLQQLSFEKALAEELTGVDIIVGGGSNTRMGNPGNSLYPGDVEFAEDYPFQAQDADGFPTLVVNVDGDYKYLGRLVVQFDDNGVIIPSSVDDAVSGAFASVPADVTLLGGSPNAAMVELRDAVDAYILTQFDNVLGNTEVFLEGRRGKVRTEETNLGNLTADAMKWYTERCDEISSSVLVLQNGGGIRAEIGDAVVVGTTTTLNPPANDNPALVNAEEGSVSEGHLRGVLRFDNSLVIVDVTGVELKMLLEHGVAQSEAGATPGRFPQVGGMAFSFDPSGTAQSYNGDGSVAVAGTRIQDIWVDTDSDGVADTALYTDGVAQGAAADTFQLVTLSFLQGGGDDYPFDQIADATATDVDSLTDCDPGLQSTFSDTGRQQDVLAEYFLEMFPDAASAFDIAETAPADDRRVQNLSVIADFVAPSP